MISLKKLWRDKRGNVLAVAGAALPLVIGSAGLASDTIQWALWKRQLQRAADSAAIAAVYQRVQSAGATTNAPDAVNADLDKNRNFWRPGKATSKLGHALLAEPAITYPTGTNWNLGTNVQLQLRKRLAFSSLFLSTPPTITASATAATVATGVYCVVSLENTAATGITATGNGNINLGCGMITNSTSLSAAIATGSSSVVASPIAAVGNIPQSTHWNGAELLPFTVQQADPFADVNPPPFTPCKGNANRLRVNSNDTVNRSTDTGVVCFSDMDLSGNVTLGSATYVIDGGDFTVGSQAHVTCNGCTIVLTNSDGGTPTIGDVDINGGAEMDMSAPTTGTYDGILFYQDRRAQTGSSAVNKINGNSDSLMTGAFYFPNQQLQINGTAGLTFTCAQFVARTVEFSGNGSITNTCTAGYGDDAIMGRHVRLVA